MPVRALIIDDSPMARKIIRHHFAKFGCKVVAEAENAAQGLKLFHETRPDIVTLDVMMPEVGGVDSISALKALRQENPNLAIVVVSAVPFEKTRNSFISDGALAYVVKPFNQFSFEPVRLRLMRMFPELAA